MQYYMMNQDKDYTDNIEIVNWFKKIDVEKLEPGKYQSLEEFYIFEIKGSEVVDMLFSPFFAVSKMVYHCIKTYEPNMMFTPIALWNKEKEQTYEFFIPHLEREKILTESSVINNYNTYIEKAVKKRRHLANNYIFMLENFDKRQVIIKKELAESILKRGVRGSEFIPIEEE
ncbi:MAG: hypothetical protein IJD58_12615 [Lachnospiraceae bacterium]|nr:hypothetical protein [Lachnospiraceae bacterium]